MNFIPEAEYRRIQEILPILCVDMVIRQGDYFLLVRRGNEPAKGEWWLPGGRVRKMEKTTAAAARIAREEVGLETTLETSLGMYETVFDTGPFGVPVHTVNACYRLLALPGQLIRLDPHHTAFQWVRFDAIPDELNLDRRLIPLLRHP